MLSSDSYGAVLVGNTMVLCLKKVAIITIVLLISPNGEYYDSNLPFSDPNNSLNILFSLFCTKGKVKNIARDKHFQYSATLGKRPAPLGGPIQTDELH